MAQDKCRTLGELKQALTRDYNLINSRLFSTGVVTLKIDIVDEKIFMLAVHKRVVPLQIVSEQSALVADIADYYLVRLFKSQLKEILTKNYQFEVSSIFKDYDRDDELSSTVVLLKNEVQAYLH